MAQDGKNKKHFFKEFRAELKKVIWPTPKQLINGTIAVITIVLITAVIVFVLDLCFDLFNNYGVNKLKGIMENSQSQVEEHVHGEGCNHDSDTDDNHGDDDHDHDIDAE